MDETDSSREELSQQIVMWRRDRNTKTTKDTVLKFKVGAAVVAFSGNMAETGSC